MVFLKYEEDNFSENQKKTSTGLIIAIAVAILIIAAAAWFALSRYDSGNALDDTVSDIKSNMGSMYEDVKSDINSFASDVVSDFSMLTSDINSEYVDITSSYNNVSSTDFEMINSDVTQPTGENVTSVPYGENFSKPVEGEIVKKFSDKELVYSKTFGDMRLHSGIDIACEKGTHVSSCGDGKVIGIDESSPYGTVLSIDMGNGLTAKYSSLNDIKFKVGDTVKAGDILGVTGTVPAELGDKEHLHFEIFKNGIAVNPFEALNLED